MSIDPSEPLAAAFTAPSSIVADDLARAMDPLPRAFLGLGWARPAREQGATQIDMGLRRAHAWPRRQFLAAMEHASLQAEIHPSMAELALREICARVDLMGAIGGSREAFDAELRALAPSTGRLASKGEPNSGYIRVLECQRRFFHLLKADHPDLALAALGGRPMEPFLALGACCRAGALRCLPEVAAAFPSSEQGPFLAKAIQAAIERPRWQNDSPHLQESLELLMDLYPAHSAEESVAIGALAKRCGSEFVAACFLKSKAMREGSAIASVAALGAAKSSERKVRL